MSSSLLLVRDRLAGGEDDVMFEVTQFWRVISVRGRAIYLSVAKTTLYLCIKVAVLYHITDFRV